MPSTSTSSPPLFVLVTRASTISPLRRFSQLASTAAPLSERISRPSSGSNRSTTTSIRSPGLGRPVDELLDRDDAFALGAEVDEDALAPDADDLSLLRAAAELLAAVGLGHVLAVGGSGARALDVEGRRVEARHRGLELGVEVGVPLTLQGELERRCLGAFARAASSASSIASSRVAASVRVNGFLVRHGRRVHQNSVR